jgi:hypothetical protein
MKQSRLMSIAEAIANVIVGYGIAVLTQLVVFPWFGLPARIGDALAIGGIFTIVSITRGFALRRLFEAIRVRSDYDPRPRSRSGLAHRPPLSRCASSTSPAG